MQFLRSQLRLFYITDDALVQSDEFLGRCRELLSAGVTTLQLRYSGVYDARILTHMAQVVALCKDMNRYCFATEDAVLAAKLACDGVFFTKMPKNLQRVREFLGVEKFIGVNISHKESESLEIHQNDLEVADFVGVGPVLQFGDKLSRPLGVERAIHLTRQLRGKPLFWNGGIRAQDLEKFGKNFADGIGVVRCLRDAQEPVQAVRSIHHGLAKALGPSMWSVGHPPVDASFKFSDLSAEQLQSNTIPLLFH